MKSIYKSLGLLLAGALLAACGGGGGDGHGGFTPPQSGTITLSATRTELPVNDVGYQPIEYGNPTQAEVTITFRHANGSLVSGEDLHVSISPTNVAALSCLVDGDECEDGNQLFGSVVLPGTNGQASIFVNATQMAGTATLTVSAKDPQTSATVSASMRFTVVSGVGTTPASIQLNASPAGIYMPGSSGNTNSVISAVVRDGAGQLVPNPAGANSGADNLVFEIIGDHGGARLSANSVSGPASGARVTTHTVNGRATVSFQSGSLQGPIQIRATADRADNDVSNGVSDPLSVTTSVIVSDGKLYSLELTSPLFAPRLPGIEINSLPVSDDTVPPPAGDDLIPPNPDATLSLHVTALAMDRQGNPVIPGTPLRFGLVDTPVIPYDSPDGRGNQFAIAGLDGNPREGGTLFTAPTGRFQVAGAGAGPGDALLVFGKAVQGNADLHSAATVTTINSNTSLNVDRNFNLNNTTGTSVDHGSVLPYLIGRALHGNISNGALTDEMGRAHGRLNYTVNTVGHAAAIWVQGDGTDNITGGNRLVADSVTLTYPGVAPATLVASPNPILGNREETVTVCVADALGIPLRGLAIDFRFNGLTGGSGTVDGTSVRGTLGSRTGANGCADAIVRTTGLAESPADGNSGEIIFMSAGAEAAVEIVVEVATLQASPAMVNVPHAGVSGSITITARAADGSPVSGAVITGTCTASGGDGADISPASFTATTGANGTVVHSFTATDFVKLGSNPGTDPPTVGHGQCIYTSASNRSVTVPFNGVASSCDFSPLPPECQ